MSPHHVRAGAGLTINGLVRWLVGQGLAGLEAWAGTPGTVGGALHGNAHFKGVNIGDLMAHWTKNAYVSTPHRVLLGMEARQSLAFFKLTNEDEMVMVGNKQMDALLGRNRVSAP